MARKKYSDFKNDPVIKAPAFAWLMNRAETYIVILGVSSYVIGGFLYSNYQSMERILADPVEESDFQAISAINSPGMNWAKTIINTQPPVVSEWNVSDSQKPRNIQVPGCIFTTQAPISLLSTMSAQGNGIKTEAQVYGAGQALTQFNTYIETTKDCAAYSATKIDNGTIAVSSQGFMITMGDAILSVTHGQIAPEAIEELKSFYIQQMTETLTQSECKALNVSNTDAQRSLFYNEEAFTGLTEAKGMKTNVDISNLPKVTGLSLFNINTPGLELPEEPLPEGFPQMPAEAVAAPEVPTTPQQRDTFEGEALYKIADDDGPGCGWNWSSQKSPANNLKALENDKNKTIKEKQTELDQQATAYVTENMDWASSMFGLSTKVDKWNKYAKNVNEVHDKWNWLNNQRAALYAPWIQYIENYQAWDQFDKNKAAALAQYKEELRACQVKQDELKEWEDKYGKKDDTETPDEDNKEIPPRPAGCDKLPTEPAILNQEKPAKPEAPEIPEGVTIPNSWPKV